MEAKKNPKADLTRKTSFFFSIALLITMSFVLFAFEFKQYETPIGEIVQRNTDQFETIEPPITEITPPPPPKVVAPIIVEVPEDEEIEKDIKIDIDMETSETESVAPVEIKPVVEPEEPADIDFIVVEEPASPKNGMKAFYEYMAKEVRYPTQARRMGVEGKVFVEFVIAKDGSIVDVKVMKGIGAGCDEEAVRVVKSAPSWNPGKQRGKPVRQKMAAQVVFRLGH